MASSGNDSSSVVLPKGGGALHGIGESFAPDLHTGTGNFTIPIAIPPGRNGFQPQLNLVYSTGSGNGPFGLGWGISIPAVSRKTSRGVPLYTDSDVFLLSAAEDLVPVPDALAGAIRYRPRTEGLFAQILRHQDGGNDYWQVSTKDGLVNLYGTPAAAGNDPAVVADPKDRGKAFAWNLSETADPFGNRIVYTYDRDFSGAPREWDQLYLQRIRYIDYAGPAGTEFLVSVTFEYANRPDPFSEYRAGFEIRTRRRCTRIVVRTHAGNDRIVRVYHLIYVDERPELAALSPPNGISLLSQVRVVGHDGNLREELAPLEFGYTVLEPRRQFSAVEGPDLPPASLAQGDVALVDLFGQGLPDLLEMTGVARYWRNLGNGRFALPRLMPDAPAGITLRDPGVQLIDADGDGRTDLFVSNESMFGYYPLRFGGLWDRASFQSCRPATSFDLTDPEVRLVDLDGDGITDIVRAGNRLEWYRFDRSSLWTETRLERKSAPDFPDVTFSDQRVRWADMNGDGLQDIVLVHDGNIEYWPALGHGKWAQLISMQNAPRFPFGYDPARILLGDVDGDGAADLVYVEDGRVTLWINQTGNGWGKPIVIDGTPPVADGDAIRLVDLLGNGISGLLLSKDAAGVPRHHMFFLDFTEGAKPYLLDRMDNHIGAVTRVEYAPSTHFYLADEERRQMRWKTPLPFPVHVVARTEVIDELSGGKLTREYHYHHGYWDGGEREFRGFGRVDQLDTETFEGYHGEGLHPGRRFEVVAAESFSPPTETRTWFHQGPIGDEFGEWEETDFSGEFWAGDSSLLGRPPAMADLLRHLPRRARRDALRTLRGRVLRTEIYARDDTERQDLPYTVTEALYGVREESPPAAGQDRAHIVFPHMLAQRITQWERGEDPMTQLTFYDDYDALGRTRQETKVALPRRLVRRTAGADESRVLTTHVRTEYATSDPAVYIADRVAHVRAFELRDPGTVQEADPTQVAQVLADQVTTAQAVHGRFRAELNPWLAGAPLPGALKLIGHTVNHYDGPEFVGRVPGEAGLRGALTRTESLLFTDEDLDAAYGVQRPAYLGGPAALPAGSPMGFGAALGYRREADSAAGYHQGYYADSVRRKFDFQTPLAVERRGMALGVQDALGHEATVTLDAYSLMPQEIMTPAGLKTTVRYDYRVMQPAAVTEPNGNSLEFTFTPLGLLARTFVRDNAVPSQGDNAHPSVEITYDFLAFAHSPPLARQPISVRTRRRAHHDGEAAVLAADRDSTIEVVEYSDGFGRLLQIRTRAEDIILENPGDPLRIGSASLSTDLNFAVTAAVGRPLNPEDSPYVVVSGWKIYDNKGHVVVSHEPFFSSGWPYATPTPAQSGARVTTFYDSRGRVVRAVSADGSEQRIVWGIPAEVADPDTYSPTPWEVYNYDANDNAGRTHTIESASYAHHWNTPSSARTDALMRTIETVDRTRAVAPAAIPAQLEFQIRRQELDVQGNILRTIDSLNREAFRYRYDMMRRTLRVDSLDAGSQLTIFDALGNAVDQRDSRGVIILRTFDAANRPHRVWARDNAASALTLREVIEYGDGGDANQPPAAREANRRANRLGRVARRYDEAGIVTFETYDFKGNVLERTRRVFQEAVVLAGSEPAPVDWAGAAFRIDWQPPENGTLSDRAEQVLTAIVYRTSFVYDALNRIAAVRCPANVGGHRSSISPYYNRAGMLDSIKVDGAAYVTGIHYNAKGQRTLICYGNRRMTRYAYDAATFRVRRVRTERYDTPTPVTYRPVGTPLQDLGIEYDLTGNVISLRDRTPGCGVAAGPLGPDALDRVFTYDPLYRLITATGRACADVAVPRPWLDRTGCGYDSGNHGTIDQDNAPNLTALYRTEYSYDPGGNLVRLRFASGVAAWTRHFGFGGLRPDEWAQEWPLHVHPGIPWVAPPTNRTTHVGDNDPAPPQTHFYDAGGNVVRETTTRHFQWDHGNRLRNFRTQAAGAEPSIYVQYFYDGSGQRIMKVSRRQGGGVETTVYIDGIYEHHRWQHAGAWQENTILHVMDGRRRIAAQRFGQRHPGDHGPRVQYHLGDHLGSSTVVVGGDGAGSATFVNREEYFPYGETSFGSFGRKRYRYNGLERDEESGLSCHQARYYAPWLMRWVSPDPAQDVDGPNSYVAFASNPLAYVDPTGTQSESAELQQQKVMLYEVARLTGALPQPRRGRTINAPVRVGDFNVYTNTAVDESGRDTISHFTAVAGGEIWYVIAPDAMNHFIDKVKDYTAAVNLLNFWGRPTEGTWKSLAGISSGSTGLYVEGLGQEWTRSLKDPAFYLSVAAMYAGASQQPTRPSVRLNERGLPQQLHRPDVRVGPAFSTLDEAAAAARGGHHLEVIVRNEQGQTIARWFEASEQGLGSLGHTEQKFLLRVNLREGLQVEMRGPYAPCPWGTGCRNALQIVSDETGARFTYRQYNAGGGEAVHEIVPR